MTGSTQIEQEEISYAHNLAMTGNYVLKHGKYYYMTSKKMVMESVGVVTLGSVVETEHKRKMKGQDQDFGALKIMFYLLLTDSQVELVKKKHPETKFYYFDNRTKEAIILTWHEYKELLHEST